MLAEVKRSFVIIPRQPGEEDRAFVVYVSPYGYEVRLTIRINGVPYSTNHTLSSLQVALDNVDIENRMIDDLCYRLYRHLTKEGVIS
ncbi:hypothetical protein D3C75_158820 [compost metagenome]